METRSKRPDWIPDWMGRYPFEPGEVKPIIITDDKKIPLIFGIEGHRINTSMWISTEKVDVSIFEVLPGGYWLPHDIHGGDEVYFVLEGTGVMFNPETGETLPVSEGDAVLIPKETWHQIYNFEDKILKVVCSAAPSLWTADESGRQLPPVKVSKFYRPKGESINE